MPIRKGVLLAGGFSLLISACVTPAPSNAPQQSPDSSSTEEPQTGAMVKKAASPSALQVTREPCNPNDTTPDGRAVKPQVEVGVSHTVPGASDDDDDQPTTRPYTRYGCAPSN